MNIRYHRIWDIDRTSTPQPVIMEIEQDWVPTVGTTVYFPDKTCGTVTDLALRYRGGSQPRSRAYVEVWVK